jgi:hypothetical protein
VYSLEKMGTLLTDAAVAYHRDVLHRLSAKEYLCAIFTMSDLTFEHRSYLI